MEDVSTGKGQLTYLPYYWSQRFGIKSQPREKLWLSSSDEGWAQGQN